MWRFALYTAVVAAVYTVLALQARHYGMRLTRMRAYAQQLLYSDERTPANDIDGILYDTRTKRVVWSSEEWTDTDALVELLDAVPLNRMHIAEVMDLHLANPLTVLFKLERDELVALVYTPTM